ncbi:uncharacterized protein LOC132522713 [Lagenorhynchus albirostris]|uniref:uncharacterized protein LOC132522713 n=1 Tax=Lagenorhynchus albirostris TaxID=27610 RepID=UPI0028EC6999|nr:uncharacterized protein LOC132522713 [Lagenorhynchus albirostris]XP_060009243.1 uncharacterized protein LOC132522713 [Lagenorhynchus albirostris]
MGRGCLLCRGGEARQLGSSLGKWCVWLGLPAPRPTQAPPGGPERHGAGFPLGRSRPGARQARWCQRSEEGVLRMGGVATPGWSPFPAPLWEARGLPSRARPLPAASLSPHPGLGSPQPRSQLPFLSGQHTPIPSGSLLPSEGAFFAGPLATSCPGSLNHELALGLGVTAWGPAPPQGSYPWGHSRVLGAWTPGGCPSLSKCLLSVRSVGPLVRCGRAKVTGQSVPTGLRVGVVATLTGLEAHRVQGVMNGGRSRQKSAVPARGVLGSPLSALGGADGIWGLHLSPAPRAVASAVDASSQGFTRGTVET